MRNAIAIRIIPLSSKHQSLHDQKSTIAFPIPLIIIMIFQRSNNWITLQLLLVLALATFTQAETTVQEGPMTSTPAYATPTNFWTNATAYSATYTVTVTSGATPSVGVYQGCCFLPRHDKNTCLYDSDGKPEGKCNGSWIPVPRKSCAERRLGENQSLIAIVVIARHRSIILALHPQVAHSSCILSIDFGTSDIHTIILIILPVTTMMSSRLTNSLVISTLLIFTLTVSAAKTTKKAPNPINVPYAPSSTIVYTSAYSTYTGVVG
ncbi:hypothetical protein NHQ30_004279 [Ciborinia camelliae]|nr:hypothetical protein NHQ30_004279 [Ciborinia camelliae]